MATSEEIKTLRRRLGETQATFASRFGVDQATIHRWENDGIPTRGAARMAVDTVLRSAGLGYPKTAKINQRPSVARRKAVSE